MHLSNWKRTTMDNELALIELVKKGDKKAYNTLVLKYQDRLVYSVYKFLKDFELAQDIAQEAFIKAYKNIEKSVSYTHLTLLTICSM